jgi:hypothetical protein
MCLKFTAWMLILALSSAHAQQPPLSVAAQRVKAQVDRLPIGGKLTVEMPDGREYYGNLHSIEPDSFSIREVDLKTVLTIRYADAKKVLPDYGRIGLLGKRVHPRRSHIIGLAIIAALLVITFVAVATDKS